jgi:hypothetical protein
MAYGRHAKANEAMEKMARVLNMLRIENEEGFLLATIWKYVILS